VRPGKENIQKILDFISDASGGFWGLVRNVTPTNVHFDIMRVVED
jgi:hypothetical protein